MYARALTDVCYSLNCHVYVDRLEAVCIFFTIALHLLCTFAFFLFEWNFFLHLNRETKVTESDVNGLTSMCTTVVESLVFGTFALSKKILTLVLKR